MDFTSPLSPSLFITIQDMASRSRLMILCTFFMLAVCVPTLSMAEQEEYIYSRATYSGSPNPRGACGYGDFGNTVNDGKVTGVSRLYRNGEGCGACYQIYCKIPGHCSEDGVKVVVTDYGEGADHTDFILSKQAFKDLALPHEAYKLFGHGVVDVAYKRVPCYYGKNLVIKIEEHSQCPGYLAIVPLYQSGTYDIVGVKLCEKDSKEWKDLRKVYGAVWDFQNSPLGALKLKFKLKYGEEKWDEVDVLIPEDWKPGKEYDTGFAN